MSINMFPKVTKDPLAVMGAVILSLLVLLALLAPVLAPCDPVQLDLTCRLMPPGPGHLMGTDALGRDVLSRIIYGTRISLMIAIIVAGIEVLVGTVVGTAAGFLGKAVDEVLMRIVDILMAFPGIILSLVIVGMMGASVVNMIIALSATGWVRYARIIRGSILSVKNELFIDAARAIGCSRFQIVAGHILPNVISPVIILATLSMGGIITSIAGLSFLGLGAQPPVPEWGIMLNQGKPFMQSAPHLMISPGIMIMMTVLAFNFIGDGLRDMMDTRQKNLPG